MMSRSSPLFFGVVVVRLEEHRAAVAHDPVHPGLVADELQPVVAEALADAERADVGHLVERRAQHDPGGELAAPLQFLVGRSCGPLVRSWMVVTPPSRASCSTARTCASRCSNEIGGMTFRTRSAARPVSTPVAAPSRRARSRRLGIRRAVGDARQLQREAVGEEHAAVEAVDEHRVFRRHRVDERSRCGVNGAAAAPAPPARPADPADHCS
jgi:hypothetical protein